MNTLPVSLPHHTFILKLNDRPGAMELIAATFAHRGISLSWTLGSDGASSPDGYATVLVHFAASPARKEAVKRALSRLSRMVSVTEPTAGGAAVRKGALVRLAPGTPSPIASEAGLTVEHVATDAVTEETIYSLLGPPDAVDALLNAFEHAGYLRAATHTVLAL